MSERLVELSESDEVQGPPLSMEHFARVQNNFFLQFVDEPLNVKRYQLKGLLAEAMLRRSREEEISFPLNPFLIKLQEENPELARRLTEEITKKGDQHQEAVMENLALLYEAYLLQRTYLKPGDDEWKVFDFFECVK